MKPTGNLDGMDIFVVEPGTEIKHDKSGETLVVSESNAVTNGRKIYMTQGLLNTLKGEHSNA
ncbi:hypothetical protein [Sulfitobacter sp. M23508]|uniref:hypothetical protein n=1 Tax=Sulfitobacter sp. M23508 TaxID=3368577 RepID=UPI003748E871